MEKRRAESAGTFNIASEIVKPRISHSRDPRLSKMQLVTRLRGLFSQKQSFLSKDLHKWTFYIHFHTWLDADSSSLVRSLSQDHFLNYPAMADHNSTRVMAASSFSWLIQVATTWRYDPLGKKSKRRGVTYHFCLYKSETLLNSIHQYSARRSGF